MRKVLIALSLTFLVTVAASFAQVQQWTPESASWTAAQRAVWDAEVACLQAGVDAVDTRLACVHADYYGWGVDAPAPIRFHPEEFRDWFNMNTINWIDATPLHILVDGNLAVIQLIVRDETTNSTEDETKVAWVAWTDVMVRTDGKWQWIADHGHVLK